MANVIQTALEMPLAARRTRHEALLKAVCKHDVASWAASFLSQLERMRSSDDPASWRSPEPIRSALEKLGQAEEQARPDGRRPARRRLKDQLGQTLRPAE